MPHPTIAPKEIDWKLGMTKAEQAQTVAPGTNVIFKWSGTHNVWLMPNKVAYNECDFDQARELASTSVNEYTYKAPAAGTVYFTCKVEGPLPPNRWSRGHCKFGNMKLVLTVASAPAPKITAAPPATTAAPPATTAAPPTTPAPIPAPAPTTSLSNLFDLKPNCEKLGARYCDYGPHIPNANTNTNPSTNPNTDPNRITNPNTDPNPKP